MEIIRLDQVSYKYRESDERFAVKDVSLSIQAGEWIAIIGHNGSGKSTLAKLINGLLAATSGTIVVDGEALTPETIWDIRRKVGMVFQNPDNQFVGVTVLDDVVFGMENIGLDREEMTKRLHQSLARVRMSDMLEREPARLSGGQKQRVAIASVTALQPAVMILDEATSMLDPLGRREVMETVTALRQEQALTVLSITHDLDEAAKADRIFVMRQGELVHVGTPEEIFSRGEALIELGLDVPFVATLMTELRSRGVVFPKEQMSEKEMVDWLCQLLSTK